MENAKNEHIGFVSMLLAGHLNPMTALARKLRSRGHEIVFIGVPDAGPYVRAAGLPFDSNTKIRLPLLLGEGWGEGATGVPFDLNNKFRLPLPLGEGWGEGAVQSNL